MAPAADETTNAPGAPGVPEVEDLSEEDKQLRDTIHMLVERVGEADAALQLAALEALRTQIRSSAVSMTSVPKALKFLRHEFEALVAVHARTTEVRNAQFLADVLSVIAMTVAPEAKARIAAAGGTANLTLRYRMEGQQGAVGGEWGHEYVRHVAMEVMDEYRVRRQTDRAAATLSLLPIAREIATFFLDHNAEPDACDLLFEIEQLPLLVELLAQPMAVESVASLESSVASSAATASLAAADSTQSAAETQRDHARVCLYLLSCVPYEADGDDAAALRVAYDIYLRVAHDLPHALIVALRLNDAERVRAVLAASTQASEREQLAFILARQRSSIALDDETMSSFAASDERMQLILNNAALSKRFRTLAAELDVVAPRVPEDVYKSHLQDTPGAAALASAGLRIAQTPTARQNLAAAVVSAFLNAGSGTEALLGDGGVDGMTFPEGHNASSASWIHKTKDHGVTTTVASIGLVHLWDPETGLAHLDRYLYSENALMRAGAIIGVGLVHAGTRNEADPALALLREYLEANDAAASDADPDARKTAAQRAREAASFRTAALMGLALAYGGSARQDVADAIMPHLAAPAAGTPGGIETAAMAALALGHVFVGTCNGDIASSILQTIMEARSEDLDAAAAPFLALALALVYLGKTEAEAAVILETLRVVEHPIGGDAATLVKICSYAGSGNVLKIQELLQICTRRAMHVAEERDNADSAVARDASASTGPSLSATSPRVEDASSHQRDIASDQKGNASSQKGIASDQTKPKVSATVPGDNSTTFAVLGIALICMMEDVGKEMSHRLFSHLMQFGLPPVRKAVPLAIGVLHASHPTTAVMDILGKYSHDHDKAVAVNSIFAMGLAAAGTNNAKMAQMLRHLAAYYQRDADCLFMVRIAQGLVHAGKGTLGLSPMHTHRQLIAPNALAGLLTVCIALNDTQALLLEHSSYLLLFLAPALYPRFMMALDADTLEPVSVLVRVGQAVDVVGQAGKPKTISGFQTHQSPVLLAHHERAELATEEYYALSPVLENFVLVRRNPNWVSESAPSK